MQTLKGVKQTLEHIQKRVEARKINGTYTVSEETKRKIRKARAKQIITLETRQKQSIANKKLGILPPIMYGENHPGWKGDKVQKGALHAWVVKQLGKPEFCEGCGTEEAKRFHWANKTYQYKRDLDDWLRLCPKCHIQYDKAAYKDSGKKRWETRRKNGTDVPWNKGKKFVGL